MSNENNEKCEFYKKFQQRMSIASNDEERIKLFRETLESCYGTLDQEKKNDVRKNESVSNQFLEKAHLYFNNELFEEALNSFTRSISTAPVKCKSLGLAFDGRSIALRSMGKLQECLADIERALSHNYPKSLQFKLRLRQAHCYRDLGLADEAEQSFRLATNMSQIYNEEIEAYAEFLNSKISESNVIFYPNVPEIILNNNKFIPGASDAIDVAYSDSFGRHIIAFSDIQPGDVIIAEQSFAATLNPKFWWTHCCNCMRRSLTLIPCSKCTWAMFCNEKCYELAFTKYHSVECEVVTKYLENNDDAETSELLTLRIIATIGLDKFIESTKNSDPPLQSSFKDDFSKFFDLISHDRERCVEEITQACFIAYNLTKCFVDVSSSLNTDRLAGIILRIFLIKDSNAHTLVEITKENNVYKTVKIGSGIFLASSLVNHSCDPNVFRVNYCNTLVHRASRFIKKGTQIMISYGVQYDKIEKLERWTYLKKYYFDCSCVACSENWPLKLYLPVKPNFHENGDDTVQHKYFKLMVIKENIINNKSNSLSYEDKIELNSLNLKISCILSSNDLTMNQNYIEVENEIKKFYRKMSVIIIK